MLVQPSPVAWAAFTVHYVYDSSVSAGAYKVGGELSLADFIPGGSIAAWTLSDDGDTDYVKGHDWGVTAKMSLSDSLTLAGGYSVTDPTAGSPTTDWTVGLNWAAAPGLAVYTEYNKSRPTGSASTGRYAFRITRSF